MTFDSLAVGSVALGGPASYVEDGITATAGDLINLGAGNLHLDDSGVAVSNASVSFTMTLPFNAVAVDLNILGFDPDPFENVMFTGRVGGATIAQATHQTGSNETYVFAPAFSGLDTLIITALSNGFGAPGGHFEVDNLVLTPVPLPPGALLLGTALIMLRRKRRQ